MPWVLSLPREASCPLLSCLLLARVEWRLGRVRSRDDVPFARVGGEPLSSQDNYYTPTSSVHLGACAGAESAPADCDDPVTIQGPRPLDRQPADCSPCTPDFLDLVSEGKPFGFPQPSVSSSPVPSTHLRATLGALCTNSGRELARVPRTRLGLGTSGLKALDSLWESLRSAFSFCGCRTGAGI